MSGNEYHPAVTTDPYSSNGEEHLTVDEIIGNSPGWILHSGMTVLLIVVGIGVGLTFLISYPDKISSRGVITTTDPFKPLVTRSTGWVDTVFVTNGEVVKAGNPIIYIGNSASREQVDMVHALIDTLARDPAQVRMIQLAQVDLSLGPMQNTFASLVQLHKEYQHYLHREDFQHKLEVIDREIEEINLLNQVLVQEKELSREEVLLSEKDLDRNEILFDQGIISERELERSQVAHLSVRKSFLIKGNNISQNKIRIAGLEQQKLDIHTNRQEQILLYQSRISEIILNFQNLYQSWFQQNYVIAPADGTIQLSSDMVSGQSVVNGKTIGFVIPTLESPMGRHTRANRMYAKVWVPSAGMGKINTGSRTIIYIDAYPYKEYGTVESHVEKIYPMAEVQQGQSLYEIHMPLDSNLITDYGYEIKYSPEMPIQVSIIATERSLFNRIFDQFINLLNHTMS